MPWSTKFADIKYFQLRKTILLMDSDALGSRVHNHSALITMHDETVVRFYDALMGSSTIRKIFSEKKRFQVVLCRYR
ncbi:hypothetical protein CK477_22940 [Enterobacter cloacae]|nr:hypothetical protein CK477_22940 [Enterobacter cloacae]